jgi:hypothetical protein
MNAMRCADIWGLRPNARGDNQVGSMMERAFEAGFDLNQFFGDFPK